MSTVAPNPVRVVRGGDVDDRAVLVDRTADGAELEIGPIATTRGARWTRAEGLMGLGLVALLFGGALLNSIANPGPQPSPTANLVVPPPNSSCTRVEDGSKPTRARLRIVGETGAGASGRTGLTAETYTPSAEDWLLPRPSEGFEIGLNTPLEVVNGTACVAGWQAWAVSTRDIESNSESSMVVLGEAQFAITSSPFQVPGPPANGDWTLRIATKYRTESNDTIWSVKFFRVIVGGAPFVTPVPPTPRPTAAPTPAITPAVACVATTLGAGPPLAFLVVPGEEPIAGTLGAFTWFGTEAGPANVELSEGPTVPFEGDVEVHISNDYCATRWSISSMTMEQGDTTVNEGGFGAMSEWATFSSNRGDNPLIAQQNRIAVKPVGLGRTAVRAVLNFEGGHVVQIYWLVRIDAFAMPPVRVIAPNGSQVTPVIGCGVSMYDNENGFGEECPIDWPILEDGPILTVHAGDVVTLESPEWSLQSWGVSWADQASVADGGEPNFAGYFGGQDMLNPTIARWVAPPVGEWALRIDLSHQDGERYFNLPVHIRLNVLP